MNKKNKKRKKCRDYNVMDFTLGFRGQLDSYHKPLLNKVSDEMWYDLCWAESQARGSWSLVERILASYRRNCFESPKKAAEYLITLEHKAYIYKDVEPELSAHYVEEYNEMQGFLYHEIVIREKFGFGGSKKFYKMVHSTDNCFMKFYFVVVGKTGGGTHGSTVQSPRTLVCKGDDILCDVIINK